MDIEKSLGAIRVGDNQHLSVAPRSGTMTSTFIPTSTGGKRRVHAEGLKMLDNHYEVLEERTKLQSMENRLKRLEFEEHRAKKMENLANQRLSSQMEARNRHFEDMVLKKNFYINLQINENMQREKNLQNRAETRSTIHLRR